MKTSRIERGQARRPMITPDPAGNRAQRRAAKKGNPLGLTEQQHADSALNKMIETLPSPLKNMSGMHNGMTMRPTAQPVQELVHISGAFYGQSGQ